MILEMDIKPIEEFKTVAQGQLSESFIARIKTFKQDFAHVLEQYQVSYDVLCQTQLRNFIDVLNGEEFEDAYAEAIEKNQGFIKAFDEILEDTGIIEETIDKFYDQMFNFAYFKAVLLTEQELVKFQ